MGSPFAPGVFARVDVDESAPGVLAAIAAGPARLDDDRAWTGWDRLCPERAGDI